MTFPLRRAKSKKRWASVVLGKKNALVSDENYIIYPNMNFVIRLMKLR